MRSLIYFFIFLFFCACGRRPEGPNYKVPNYSFSGELKDDDLQIDSLEIDLSQTSCIGRFYLVNKSLVFIDTEFASAYIFDEEFELLERKLGLGNGPNEVFGINWLTVDSDSSIVIFDTNGFIYYVDQEWSVTNRSKFEGYYCEKWKVHFWTEYYGKSIRSFNPQKIIIPITVEEKRMNPYGMFNASDVYYKYCPALGEIDVLSGRTERVMASRPPIYGKKENRYLAMYNFMDFVIDDNLYYISWAIDSLIYVYQYPDSLLYTFGLEGNYMNTHYTPYLKIKEAQANFANDLEQFGYYTQLEFDKESGLLFRVYYKGSGKGSGLQIYNGSTLIADVKVPKDFKILGSLDGCFYGSGEPDEDKENVLLYRFKIPGLCEN